MEGKSSAISGFYKLSPQERAEVVKGFSGLSDEEVDTIRSMNGLSLDMANRMIENVIGAIQIPLGIATNFLINGRDCLIPMAIEEPSVVAACSNAARMARGKGGFRAISTEQIMIGQIQTVGLEDVTKAKEDVLRAKEEVLGSANAQDPILVSLGGGAKDLEAKVLSTPRGEMLIIELIIDCKDAMGANVVNTMCEGVAPLIEQITGGRVYLRIVSNLATRRLVRAEATFAREALGGEGVVDGIILAHAFADADPYRCATHNKGIMNGIIALALATGQDSRALEAGAHAYACRSGRYSSLTSYEKKDDGDLVGRIELPIAVGLVGGATATHPVAKSCVKILGVRSARELGEVMGAVGLAQNLGALRALVAEGIQRGHMKLHSRNIAVMAGAQGDLIDEVAERMVREGRVRLERAKEILAELRASGG